MKFLSKKRLGRMVILFLAGITMLFFRSEAEASNGTRIHFISLASATDAILLESNGHYGMVDSGEDWDYPDGVEYPLRDGVTRTIGYEQQVIYYLEQLGVEKLDFYIATHSHSDHIGSGDEILDHFPTERLYINEYKDEYLSETHSSDPNDPYYTPGSKNSAGNRLWDNQYVYDRLIQAAQRNGTQIIMDLDLPENEQYRIFSMGDMTIEILNYERDREEDGTIIPMYDENCNSLVTKVTAFDKVALLTSDMDPWRRNETVDSDTVRVVQKLIEQLWTEEDLDQGVEVAESYEQEIYQEPNGVVLSMPDESVIIDESQVNRDKTISLDLLKMSHHALDYNNTTYFLTSLNPKTAVVTGYESWINAREKDCMPGAQLYATASDSAAVVAEFNQERIDTQYVKVEPGWMEFEEKEYYFDENGRTFTDSGNHKIGEKEYCFDAKGAVDMSDRWVALNDGGWRYWKGGEYASNEWVDWGKNRYYCDETGKIVYGWQWIDGKCYYFSTDGIMQRDAWFDGHYVDGNGVWIKKYSTAKWIKTGGKWWYRYGNGEYPANRSEMIDGVRYYFDREGWMAEDCWKKTGGRWWYQHSDGSYTTSDWEKINGAWYYFDEKGWMLTGWQFINNAWYYLESSGKMATNTWIGDYYVDATGVWDVNIKRPSQWIASGNRWWYRHGDGSYTVSNWENINGEWYYFDRAGWMLTGWQFINNAWYYLETSGKMAVDTWIGDYYVNADGVWDVNMKKPSRWILSGNRWWYCHEDGSYTKSDWEEINGKRYYFDEAGWMVTGWRCIGEKWYYMDSSGAMLENVWVGNYYLKSGGVMATSEWVEGGKYYVDETGKWVPKA